MRADAIFDHAIVDVLQGMLEGARNVHIVGSLSEGARQRLAASIAGILSIADRPGGPPASCDAVVVLDVDRLAEAETAVGAGGTLIVAAANARYGPFLLDVLQGRRAAWPETAGLEGVCRRLEADGWEVEDAIPVAVPLALIPFDPARVPKTVLAYLYAHQPEIETYCFLVHARRPVARPPRPRLSAPRARVDFPTTPWKTESEWHEEATGRAAEWADQMERHRRDVEASQQEQDAALRALEQARQERDAALSALEQTRHERDALGLTVADRDDELVQTRTWLEEARQTLDAIRMALRQSDDELERIKSSLAWRGIVKVRTARERLLPPQTGRGRLYDRARGAVQRIVEHRRTRSVVRPGPGRSAAARPEHGTSSSALRASAVVCTHNRGALIEETIESLLGQNLPADAFEILIVDNASRDATPRILRAISERHPGRIRVVQEPVLGLSAARNRGIRMSRGNVIAFTDDDARVSPGWLRALVEACEQPEVGCAGGPVRAALDAQLPEWMTPQFLKYLALFDKGSDEVALTYNEYPRGVNIAFPRRSFQEVGLFSTAFGRKGRSLLSCEEIELCYRLERRGRRILYVPSAEVHHVIHVGRLTVGWFKQRFYWQGKSEAYFDLVHGRRHLVMGRLADFAREARAERAHRSGTADTLDRHYPTWTGLGYGVGAAQGWMARIAHHARPAPYDGTSGGVS